MVAVAMAVVMAAAAAAVVRAMVAMVVRAMAKAKAVAVVADPGLATCRRGGASWGARVGACRPTSSSTVATTARDVRHLGHDHVEVEVVRRDGFEPSRGTTQSSPTRLCTTRRARREHIRAGTDEDHSAWQGLQAAHLTYLSW